jgi:hypothetical protein
VHTTSLQAPETQICPEPQGSVLAAARPVSSQVTTEPASCEHDTWSGVQIQGAHAALSACSVHVVLPAQLVPKY